MSRTAVALAFLTMACVDSVAAARAWEANHKAKFLVGYSNYRGEEDGTDSGYVVMSYELPPSVEASVALKEIEAQMAQGFPCYKVIERESSFMKMRCPGGRPRDVGMLDEEYQFLIRSQGRRVYVFSLNEAAPGFGGRAYLERIR